MAGGEQRRRGGRAYRGTDVGGRRAAGDGGCSGAGCAAAFRRHAHRRRQRREMRIEVTEIGLQARLLRRRVRGGGVEVGLTLIVREALSGWVLPGSPAASRGDVSIDEMSVAGITSRGK